MFPRWLIVAVLAAAVTVALLVVILAVRRTVLLYDQQRRERVAEEMRDAAVALVADGVRPEVPPRDMELFAEVLWSYSRQLTGESRTQIAAYFEAVGMVRRQLTALGHRRAWRRAHAAYSLGDSCSMLAVPSLIEALDDSHQGVRTAALRSLGRLRATLAVTPIAQALAAGRIPATLAGSVLLEMRAPVTALRPLTETGTASLRSLAVDLIGWLGGPADADWLELTANDASAQVRSSVCLALSRLGGPRARSTVRGMLADPEPPVRAAAATALGELGEHPDGEPLVEMARRDEFEPAQAAAAALAALAPDLLTAAARRPDANAHLHQAADQLAAAAR